MSLTFGGGPFSGRPGGLLSAGDLPPTAAWAEPYPRRVRAFTGGQAVLDSERGWLLHAPGRPPELWFPAGDLDAVPAHALREFPAGSDPVAQALAGYRQPHSNDAVRWFVEDEPVYAHLRDPYHRVDVLASHRHVIVEHAGSVVAESTRPKMLYETGLPPRFYLPWADVRPDSLELSETVSQCPYKGDGQHWHLRTRTLTVTDAAWSLPHPLPEGLAAAEHVSFYPAAVTVTVDGQRLHP